jgi:GDPmannose 4,6-dehydratase
MVERRSALIIGHTGQDGKLLWQRLASQRYRVLGISSSRCDDSVCGALGTPPSLGDAEAVARFISAYHPDEIYYLAAHHNSSEGRAKGGIDEWNRSYALNVLGFVHILEAVRTFAPQVRVFYACSSLVLPGHEYLRLSERTEMAPTGLYGVTKAAARHLAEDYRKRHGLYVCVGLLFNHESHLRKPSYLSRRVIEFAANAHKISKGPLEVGSLTQIVDWSHAKDFVSGFHYVMQLPRSDTYIFASGVGYTVQQLVELAFGLVGLDWRRNIVVNSARVGVDTTPRIGDPTRLISTGWSPQYEFNGMVEEIIKHFVASGTLSEDRD